MSKQLQKVSKHVLKAQYAVRGGLVLKALQYEDQLRAQQKLPFNEIVYCNIGNPQQLGQIPLTFHRNVLSLTCSPELLKSNYLNQIFKEDVILRAKTILSGFDYGSTGQYTHSQGLSSIRSNVMKFIEQRDGHLSNLGRIFLTDGASPGIQLCLKTYIRDENDAIMIPIPQYPLYTASIALYGGAVAPYYLNEDDGWSLSVKELDRAYIESKKQGRNVQALVIINPGNPTGQLLTTQNQQEIIDFCVSRDLVLIADEVYQENVYGKNPFHSFKKVASEMGTKHHPNSLQLFSFHSVSKGFLGECGRRGGYMEISEGVDKEIMDQFYKLASINLCPNVDGQIMMDLKVAPPKEGDPSYQEYISERDSILSSLKRRAVTIAKSLNLLPGVSCSDVEGAMYAFPRISLSRMAVEEARKAGMQPDDFYAMEMLNETGVCVVPGSGFGQKDGTFHFRTTILPPEDKMEIVADKLKNFHENFITKYGLA